MTRPDGCSSAVLFLTPESLYPTVGGGALRAASIYEYLLRNHVVDVVTFREDSRAVTMPGARDVLVLDLPRHSRHRLARARRNLRRSFAGRPPLLDRYSGFEAEVATWLAHRRYEFAVVEHFWCAPYAAVLRPRVRRLILDLHNIESTLQATIAKAAPWPLSWSFGRFASAYRTLEKKWLPWYDDILAASGADAARVQAERVSVYPNTLPRLDPARVTREHAVVFSGNLEYDPNISAVRWFSREVWPLVRRREAGLEWRLVGRNAHAVESLVRGADGVRVIGEVDDAVAEIGRAKAAVVPLLAASGTRFKILEAWAAETPVVSTTIGAEGLSAEPGRHLRIADDAAGFANAVLDTVQAPGDLGRQGRELYLERYTTEAGWQMLEALGL